LSLRRLSTLKGGGGIFNWLLFCLSGLGAAYSHYFALAGILLIYFFIFLRLVIQNKKNIIKCLIAIIFTICGYLPWLKVFINGVKSVTADGFWIKDVVSLKNGFIYIFQTPQVLIAFLTLLTFSIIYIYGFINISWNNTHDKKLKISFFTGKRTDDSVAWIGITATLAAYIIFIFEIIYGSITTPVFHPRYGYPISVAVWLAFSMLLMNFPFIKLRKFLYVLLCVFLIYTYWPSFSARIFSYFQENKTTQATVNAIKTRITDNTYILSDHSHIRGGVAKYYFPNAVVDWANINKNYNFAEGTDKILLIMSKELNQSQINDWEDALKANVSFISTKQIAWYKLFIYEADLKARYRRNRK